MGAMKCPWTTVENTARDMENMFMESQIPSGPSGPKTGSNRARNTAKSLGDAFVFCSVDVLMDLDFFNYSKMVDFDSRTYCNIFLMISGTSNKSTKSGPLDPVFITIILQNYKTSMGTSSEILFS